MELKIFRHLWGLEQESLATALPRIAGKGYVGVEPDLHDTPDLDGLRSAAPAHGLAVKPLVRLLAATPREQLIEYRELLELARTFDPAGITVHSGVDAWPLEESIDFYGQVVALEAELGLVGAHETHRGRPLHAPWSTTPILESVPELRLCCDFSHWVVVAERLLEDQTPAIELAASRADHLHTRVGYDQGPQVPDPRAPEWAQALAAHERWWELLWDAQRAAGATVASFTPEYGPAPYLHTLPHTNVPVADLEQVCDWQAQRTREQFAAWKS